ncbi:unnamed protein product, partial [Mesorhabditis belari]|uniref:Tyrosyl-DNA phosphodiesterase n=1 Tax=Mesorhabditis belari TaxID=2138241 RepID=A0AAF3EPP8_9BILA
MSGNTSPSSSKISKRKLVDDDEDNSITTKKNRSDEDSSISSISFALKTGYFYFVKVSSVLECFNENCFSLKDVLNFVMPEESLHFNFMIEVDWLIENFRQYPESCRQTPINLVVGEKMGSDAASLRRDIKLLKLDNIQVSGAHLPIPYGTHHTKLSLLKVKDELHIIMFYYCKAKLENGEGNQSCNFQKDLSEYLKMYNLPIVAPWIKYIEQADFGDNNDHFIYSCPGYHKKPTKDKMAQLGLRNALKERTLDPNALYIAQCSSIGSLGQKPDQWFLSQFLNSLRGGRTKGSTRVYLVYPTIQDVQHSYEGYSAGGSLPYQSKTHEKQTWLRAHLCKWRSDKRGRNKAMPHVKSYCEIGADRELKWLLITSANLSKAAWGEIQKNGEQLAVRSWEAGVLVQDPSRCGLPYDYPICRYKDGDQPWIIDKNYKDIDSHGRQWIYDQQ